MKASRIAHEKKTVELMIRLYCRKKEKNTILCADCEELLRYAHARLDHCPFGEKKSACKECTVHVTNPSCANDATGDAFLRTEDVALCTLQAIRHLLNL